MESDRPALGAPALREEALLAAEKGLRSASPKIRLYSTLRNRLSESDRLIQGHKQALL